MLKKTVTYTDFDDNTRTEDFYFNLTKAELMELELSKEGGMQKQIEKIIASQSVPQIVEIFKTLVLKAYGEKSDDGRRFMKSPEITQAFKETQAYSDIFMELSTDDKAAAAFIQGIIPDDYSLTDEEIEKARDNENVKTLESNLTKE